MITPPVCCHCGQLMQFIAVTRSIQTDAWDETWWCPEGRWSFRRTVPAPPDYQAATALRRAGRKKPRKKPR
jgi:hypothetical protein